MTSAELRSKYLEFFKQKGHAIIPSASLLPENDPTVLFNTAGMQPLVPFLMGEKHPEGNRIADVQKCVRTGDIEEVGDASHLTFFEMLGNWSLGDYFKEESIAWSWEFLTSEEWLGIDPRKLAVTVFEGETETDIPRDEEAADLWKQQGVPENRISYLGRKDNWWGPAGQTGPCGPDTEIFYWVGEGEFPPEDSNVKNDEEHWMEIWNNVFMQYHKQADGTYEPLAQKNVDTGMGLERTVAILNKERDVYATDAFTPILSRIAELSGKPYAEHTKAFRVIADHLRTAVMILGDERGIGPSNSAAGYVLRRLIRRAVRYGKQIGLETDFTVAVAETIIGMYKGVYPEIEANSQFVKDELAKEEAKFRQTLETGLRMFEKVAGADKQISGTEAFTLFSTYGFPFELTQELARERGYEVDEEAFNEEMKKHAELSKTASAGMFKGGLADASVETTRLHTAAHLMLEALRRVVGEHVEQKGSNITAERLRFDVSHPEKITPEQLKAVEEMVNEQIKKDLPVHFREMPLDEARQLNATGVFGHKYGEKVKVYFVGGEETPFSKEICGGPHVTRTGELGTFRIAKEESSGSGVRRIKAVLEQQ